MVEVGEASVIIAVSSPHRRSALEVCPVNSKCTCLLRAMRLLLLQAVAWAIDELKAVVPIWKREYFSDGSMVGI